MTQAQQHVPVGDAGIIIALSPVSLSFLSLSLFIAKSKRLQCLLGVRGLRSMLSQRRDKVIWRNP